MKGKNKVDGLDGRRKEKTKKHRNISITDDSWNNLQNKADSLNLSVSGYVERIGQNQNLLEIPIFTRLQSFLCIKDNIAVFWSLSEFTRRVGKQLNVEDFTFDRNTLDDLTARIRTREAVIKYMEKSMIAICLINYVFPEVFIEDLFPTLKTIILKDLISNKKVNTNISSRKTYEYDFSKSEIKQFGKNLKICLSNLSKFRSGFYQVLENHFIHGLSFHQIAKIKILNGEECDKYSVIEQSKEAIFQLREFVHNESIKELKPDESFSFEDTHIEYYDLALQRNLEEEDIKKLQSILKKSFKDKTLDFWMCEIDHWSGHQLMDRRSEHSDYHLKKEQDIHKDIRKEISENFLSKVEHFIEHINNQLKFSLNREDIIDALDYTLKEDLKVNSTFNEISELVSF